ncbi:MAG: DUF4537 domain-containing protein [Candidatus Lokiarchaeota archaeon]|nr:DUF4537 domain-containing protein [Candidatus Lokiarchaeota archaeon]
MLEFKKGDFIFGKSKNVWFPGNVSYIDEKGNLNIEYEDGVSEWISDISKVQKNTTFKHLKIDDLKVGDKILGNWLGRGHWFEGRIKKINKKGEVYVKYDDGDKERISDLTKIRKEKIFNKTTISKFKVGDRVIGNWKKQNQWFPGVVRVISEGRINVQYDDGDSEWIEDPLRIQIDSSNQNTNDLSKENFYQ